MSAVRQIILDTETTGFNAFDPEHPDRMLEFAGLEMRHRHLTGNSLHLFIHPQRDIPDEAAAIHGITLDKLTDSPTFDKVAQQIFDFIKGAELIIHNAKFDVGFLNAEFARVGLPNVETICPSIIDTLAMARKEYPGQKNSLDALCTRLEIDRSRRVYHGALIDCELLGEVYLAMTREQGSLIEELATNHTDHAHYPKRPDYLKVQLARESEEQEHQAFLDNMEKKLGGACLYRKMEQNQA